MLPMRCAVQAWNCRCQSAGAGSGTKPNLADLAGDMDDEVAGYVARRKAAGKKAFLDGPHFELPASIYP